MDAGALLKQARVEAGYTQEQLAAKIGRTTKSVSTWETGGNIPRRAQAQQLDEFFNLRGQLMAAFGYVTPTDELEELRRRIDEMQAQIDVLTDESLRQAKVLRRLEVRKADG